MALLFFFKKIEYENFKDKSNMKNYIHCSEERRQKVKFLVYLKQFMKLGQVFYQSTCI